MTEEESNPGSAERKLITAEEVERVRRPLINRLRREGDMEAEDTATSTIIVLCTKYLGQPITAASGGLLALAENIALKEFKARISKSDRHGQDPTDDIDKRPHAGGTENDVSRNAARRKLEALARDYSQRTGRELADALSMLEEKRLELDRGRLRRPGHYFQDEEGELRAATLALEAASYETTWGIPWDPERVQCLEILTANHATQATAEHEGRAALESLRKALRNAVDLARRTPLNIEGHPTIGGVSRKFLVATLRPNEIMLEAVEHALAGPTGYLESELHNFVGCTFTRMDYARALGCTRKPSATELATLWLLLGAPVTIKPSTWSGSKHKGEMTPAQYREKVRDKVTEAVKQYEGLSPPATAEE